MKIAPVEKIETTMVGVNIELTIEEAIQLRNSLDCFADIEFNPLLKNLRGFRDSLKNILDAKN